MIWLKVKSFFTPPVFEDEDRTRVANLFSITILTLFIVAILRSILSIWATPEFTAFVLRTNGVLFVILIAAFVIMRSGHVRFACIFFTLYQWIAIAWITYHNGGLNFSIYSFFIFVILFAGLFLGGKWALAYAMISIIYGAALVYLENHGIITPVLENPMAVFNATTLSFITTTVVVYLYHRDMTRALKRARLNTDQLYQSNEQLTHEISARKEVEQQLLQAQKMEAIGTLAGGIAHDFNNSLQAILGYIQILLFDMKDNDADLSKLRHIEAAAIRASELTQQLLTFSRKIESKLRPVNLSQVIHQVEKLLRRTLPKMIDIKIQLDDGLKSINADPAQIEQVIMNIVINARDAMPHNGKLTICAENITLDEAYCRTHFDILPGDYVVLSIADTGTGMDRDTRERIFDPFFTTKDLDKGTGLGLSMAYGIIKNHQGHITVDSEPGEGTVFKIYFPVFLLNYEKPPEQPKKIEMKGGTETILLVDDENFIIKLGEEMLRRFGYTILTAADGESALKQYQENQSSIALIILDLIMPGMGGEKCLEEIIKINPSQKVIISTGYSGGSSETNVLQKGAKSFINKPYKLDQLLTVVRDVLDE